MSSSDAKMGRSIHRRWALSVGPGSLLGTDRLTSKHLLQGSAEESEVGSSGGPVESLSVTAWGPGSVLGWAVKIIL